MSELLTTAEMETIKAQGGMVGDKEVVAVLLRTLLEPIYRDGVVLDGFPRTPVQVECLKLLVDENPQAVLRRVLEHTSGDSLQAADHSRHGAVRQRRHQHRQAAGTRAPIAEHNRKVAESGIGTPVELRPTDMYESLVRRRYQVFKEQTWMALTSLRQLYHYHFVNAEGPIEEVQANILAELRYQRARSS